MIVVVVGEFVLFEGDEGCGAIYSAIVKANKRNW